MSLGSGEHFGSSLAVDGITMYVGTSRADGGGVSDKGAVYVLSKARGAWSRTQVISGITGTDSNDYFGTAIGLGDGTFAVGTPGAAASVSGYPVGAAHIFGDGVVCGSIIQITVVLTMTIALSPHTVVLPVVSRVCGILHFPVLIVIPKESVVVMTVRLSVLSLRVVYRVFVRTGNV